MTFENKITEYFSSNLITRTIDENLSQDLTYEDNLIISQIGLPNDILSFQFTDAICLLSKSEIIIGKTSYDSNIILNLESGNIMRDHDLFISKSLKNLIQQLYIYDSLWKIDIPQEKFGNYRDNCNHKKYAEFLKTELLKIDEDLLKNDTGYFWGSLIEDIEFGIVG